MSYWFSVCCLIGVKRDDWAPDWGYMKNHGGHSTRYLGQNLLISSVQKKTFFNWQPQLFLYTMAQTLKSTCKTTEDNLCGLAFWSMYVPVMYYSGSLK